MYIIVCNCTHVPFLYSCCLPFPFSYLLKPSVLRAEKGFNPFIQRKLQDIVPASVSIKIISGMFITKKSTSLTVEMELYGLPADLVRRQYTKKKPSAPHPYWNEDYFVFKRVNSTLLDSTLYHCKLKNSSQINAYAHTVLSRLE